MSPSPTRLNRWDAERSEPHVRDQISNDCFIGMEADRACGENVARPWDLHQLAASKDKDCDRQPNQYDDVQHVDWGRFIGMIRECDPDVR